MVTFGSKWRDDQFLIGYISAFLFCSKCDKRIDKLVMEKKLCNDSFMYAALCHGDKVICELPSYENLDPNKLRKTIIQFPMRLEDKNASL